MPEVNTEYHHIMWFANVIHTLIGKDISYIQLIIGLQFLSSAQLCRFWEDENEEKVAVTFKILCVFVNV